MKISQEAVKADVGEAGGSKVSEINEAFGLAGTEGSLGLLSPAAKIAPLEKQIVLFKNDRVKISVAVEKDNKFASTGDVNKDLISYQKMMFAARKGRS
jgi:hypothetical protein